MSEKFEPVEVKAKRSPDAVRASHLRAFVGSFIIKPRRPRCLHILLEYPRKAARELHHVDRWLDPEFSKELEGSAAFPQSLESALGSARGVYCDDSLRSFLLTPAEAATLAGLSSSDAIFSLNPGTRALVFHHEGTAYLCERG